MKEIICVDGYMQIKNRRSYFFKKVGIVIRTSKKWMLCDIVGKFISCIGLLLLNKNS